MPPDPGHPRRHHLDQHLTPAAEATAVLARALDDPRAARDRAVRLLDSAPAAEARSIALRALGLAVRELGDPESARGHLESAIRTADGAGLPERAAQARLTLIGVLADLGRLDDALRTADLAGAVLNGADADRLLGHRALLLFRTGHIAEGLRAGDAALARLSAAADPTFTSGLLNNRGIARVYSGDLDAATADLERAARVADAAGLRRLAAMARVNLGFAAQRRGDLAYALHLYARAEPEFTDAAGRALAIGIDRAAALLAAGLHHEARHLLTPAIPHLAGHPTDAAEARMMLAGAELACGAPGDAATTARAAHAAFTAQHRTGWALLAEHAEIRARTAVRQETRAGPRTEPDVRLLADARGSAERLAAWGWGLAAAYGRVLAARLALDMGRPRTATAILAADAAPPRGGTAEERIVRWHATALHRLAHGAHRGALAAVRAGLRDAEKYADALGAAELRAHASVRGAELAALGLRLARASGRARTVLAWAERARAITGRPPSVRPPRDPATAEALAALRHTGAGLAEAIATERPYADLLRHHREAENAVRTATRTASLPAAPPSRRRPDPVDLPALLGDRALVEFVMCDGELLAVTLAGGRHGLHTLGRVGWDAVTAVRFGVNRLAQRHPAPGRTAGAAAADLAAAADVLDRAVFPASVRRAVGDRELVIAPCGPLYGVPWAVLPTTSGRPCTVAPSAAAWAAARTADAPRAGGRTVLVAGPGLPQAPAEIAGLAPLHPGATVLTGAHAAAAPVAQALDGAELAHVSAHAVFRAGSALLSEIQLADGALYGYDLADLARPPRRVILSACEAAMGDVTAADWPLGPVAALLGGGTATVIASVSPVHDAETAEFMIALHRRMSPGVSPSRALAETPRTPGVLGFNCLGAGT
ncbi:MAG TPA: CHAT domain-containing protein [Streptosporangiaceae bacterium]